MAVLKHSGKKSVRIGCPIWKMGSSHLSSLRGGGERLCMPVLVIQAAWIRDYDTRWKFSVVVLLEAPFVSFMLLSYDDDTFEDQFISAQLLRSRKK